jgi:hypothetical protein
MEKEQNGCSPVLKDAPLYFSGVSNWDEYIFHMKLQQLQDKNARSLQTEYFIRKTELQSALKMLFLNRECFGNLLIMCEVRQV